MTNTLHLHFLLITHSFAFMAQVLPIKSFIQLLGDFFIFTSVTSIYHFFLFSDKTTYHIGQESHFPNGENNFLTQRINFQNYKRSQGLLQVKSNYRKSFKISM